MSIEVSDSQLSLRARDSLVRIKHSATFHSRPYDKLLSVSHWELSVLGLMVFNLDKLDL